MLTGEITPSYATLSEEAFLRMRSINPGRVQLASLRHAGSDYAQLV